MAAAAGAHLGINAVLYRNTGSFGSPVWSPCQLISSSTTAPKWDKGEGSVRGSRVKQYAKTLADVTINPKMRVDYADANFAAFWVAANNDNVLNLLILNAPITVEGARGYWLDMQVGANVENQDLTVVEFQEFELFPYVTSNQQSYVIMAANNTPTSTAIGA